MAVAAARHGWPPRSLVHVVAVVAGGTDAGTSSELVDLAAASASLVFPASTEVVEVSGLRWLACRCIRLRCSCSRSEAVGGRIFSSLLLLMFTATEEPDEDEADRSRTVAVFVGVSGDLVGEVLSAVSDPMAE